MWTKKQTALDTAGLSLVARVGMAIASKGNPEDPRGPMEPSEDPNPHTATLSAYDLARLVSYVGGPYPDWPRKGAGEQIVASMVETVARTVDSRRIGGSGDQVRSARAAWLRWELDHLSIDLPLDVVDRLATASTAADVGSVAEDEA